GHVLRDLGHQQVVHVLGQHPGDVQGHVPGAEDRHLLGVQRPGARHVRMSVVPGDEVGRTVAAFEFDAGDVQFGVPDRPGGKDDCVVVAPQIRHGQVGAVVHVPDEAYGPLLQHAVQGVHDALDPRDVGGPAVAHAAVGGGYSLQQVDP